MYQKTLSDIIEFSGVGIHSGIPANVRVHPSHANTGITFVRKDIPDSPVIKAASNNVVATDHATTIGVGEATVSTVEHLLAALYCLGVDNAQVFVSGPEIPAMDGSSLGFVRMIEDVGLKAQRARRKYLLVKKPIRIKDGERFLYLLPFRKRKKGENFTVDCTIDFSHKLLDRQSFSLCVTPETFKGDVMSARTFGFLKDVEMLKKHGLARGGSLDNAVVIGDNYILNEDGLRFPDEFVRHKVLDLLGDLSLVGAPIIGRVKAFRTGHSLNYKLTQEILNNTKAWERIELFEEKVCRGAAPAFSERFVTA